MIERDDKIVPADFLKYLPQARGMFKSSDAWPALSTTASWVLQGWWGRLALASWSPSPPNPLSPDSPMFLCHRVHLGPKREKLHHGASWFHDSELLGNWFPPFPCRKTFWSVCFPYYKSRAILSSQSRPEIKIFPPKRCHVLRHAGTKNCRTRLCAWLRAQSLSHVHVATPWTAVCQAPLSMEFSRQEYWSGLPFLVIQALFHTRFALDIIRIPKAGFLQTKGLSPCVSVSLPNTHQKLPWPPACSTTTSQGSFSSSTTTNSLSLLYLFPFLSHMPCGISVSWSGIEPVPLAVEVWSLNHRTIEEFLLPLTFWPASSGSTPFSMHNPLK